MPLRILRRPPRKSARLPVRNLPITYASTPSEMIVPNVVRAVSAE